MSEIQKIREKLEEAQTYLPNNSSTEKCISKALSLLADLEKPKGEAGEFVEKLRKTTQYVKDLHDVIDSGKLMRSHVVENFNIIYARLLDDLKNMKSLQQQLAAKEEELLNCRKYVKALNSELKEVD